MSKQLAMEVNFAGRIQSVLGEVELKSISDAIMKSLITCLLCWVMGMLFMIIPFINSTLPVIFWMFGPILGVGVFYKNHRLMRSLKARLECPQCKSRIEVIEHNLSSPFSGSCPICKAGYVVHIASLEPAAKNHLILDPRDERYVPNSSAITMKTLQGRDAFFEEEWQLSKPEDKPSSP